MHEGTQQSSSSDDVRMSLWLTIGLQVAWQGVRPSLPGVSFVQGSGTPAVVCLALLRWTAHPLASRGSLTNVINGGLIGLGLVFDSEPHSPLSPVNPSSKQRQ